MPNDTASTPPDRIEREIHIAAEPETVFPFLVDAELIVRWSGNDAELDPRPGGIYRVLMGGDYTRGEFVEVDPPHRVVYTWGWEGSPDLPPGASRVEVTLTPTDGGTLLRLVHSGLPEQMRDDHDAGWGYYLGRFQVAAGDGDPGPDTGPSADHQW